MSEQQERRDLDWVQAELARRLGHEPDPDAWEYLVWGRWPGNVLDDLAEGADVQESLEDLVAHYRKVPKGRPRGAAHPAPREVGPDVRAEALALIMAAEAAALPQVLDFRREVLRGRLLSTPDVAAWVLRRREGEGRPTTWTRVPRTDGGELDPAAAEGAEGEVLSFLGPDSPWPRSVFIRAGGTLRRLKSVAARLSARYPWTEGQGVGFVLSGSPPALPRARATVHRRSRWEATTIISLELSPRMSPRDVAELYRSVRTELLGPGHRDRDIQNPARAELAVFAARVNDGRTWARATAAWNEAHPSGAYPDVRVFTRDAREAYRMVTGEPLAWRGKRGSAPGRHRGR